MSYREEAELVRLKTSVRFHLRMIQKIAGLGQRPLHRLTLAQAKRLKQILLDALNAVDLLVFQLSDRNRFKPLPKEYRSPRGEKES